MKDENLAHGEASDDQLAAGSDNNDTGSTLDERAFVANLMWPSGHLDSSLALMDDDDIADPRARMLLTVIRRMHDEGQPIDLVTVGSFAERHDMVPAGPARKFLRSYIHEIAVMATVADHLPYLAHAVLERSARRRHAAAVRQLADVIVNGDVDVIAGEIRRTLNAAAADFEAVIAA